MQPPHIPFYFPSVRQHNNPDTHKENKSYSISHYLDCCSSVSPLHRHLDLFNKVYEWPARLEFPADRNTIILHLDTPLPATPTINYTCQCGSTLYENYRNQITQDGIHVVHCKPSLNLRSLQIGYELVPLETPISNPCPFPTFASMVYSYTPDIKLKLFQERFEVFSFLLLIFIYFWCI